MAVIKFYRSEDDEVVGTVTTSGSSITGDTKGVQALVDDWTKSPSEFVAAYAHWANAYLYSRVAD